MAVKFVLETVVDDECRLVDIQVCSGFGRACLTDQTVVNQGLVALILDEIDVLLGETIYVLHAMH